MILVWTDMEINYTTTQFFHLKYLNSTLNLVHILLSLFSPFVDPEYIRRLLLDAGSGIWN